MKELFFVKRPRLDAGLDLALDGSSSVVGVVFLRRQVLHTRRNLLSKRQDVIAVPTQVQIL